MSDTVKKTERAIPFWQIIYRRLVLIILVTVLCALVGFCYSLIKVKPVYTAKTSVILNMTISEDGGNVNANNAQLAKRYLLSVVEVITGPNVADRANKVLGENKVNYRNIGVKYGERSMIFTISYRDANADDAKNKLKTVIECAAKELNVPGVIEAQSVDIVPTQNRFTLTVDNGFTMPIIAATLVGIVLGVAIAFILYAIDNTVRDREELEALTGAGVLACIENL